MRALGRRIRRLEDPRLDHGPRPLHGRSPTPGDAPRDPCPKPGRARAASRDRRGGRTCPSGRPRPAHSCRPRRARRGRAESELASARPAECLEPRARNRPRALRRSAGCGRGRGQPVRRRGRRRSRRARYRRAPGSRRHRGRAPAGCTAPLPRLGHERRRRDRGRGGRHRGVLLGRARPRLGTLPRPAPGRDADGATCVSRRLRQCDRRGRSLDLDHDAPPRANDDRDDVRLARAQAPRRGTGRRRQLRPQGSRLSRGRPRLRSRAALRSAGEVDRGPAGALPRDVPCPGAGLAGRASGRRDWARSRRPRPHPLRQRRPLLEPRHRAGQALGRDDARPLRHP